MSQKTLFGKNQKVSRIQISAPPTDNLLLHDVLKNSYAKNKSKSMKGYNLDEKLSNHNQQVYYNPTNKKLLYSIAGTHNLRDVGTDFYLGIGKLKNTNRYKEADKTLKEAKRKYGVSSASITGHSDMKTLNYYYQISEPEKKEAMDEVFNVDIPLKIVI